MKFALFKISSNQFNEAKATRKGDRDVKTRSFKDNFSRIDQNERYSIQYPPRSDEFLIKESH